MNRFYAVLICLALCLALFLALALNVPVNARNAAAVPIATPGNTKNTSGKRDGGRKELHLALDTEPQTLDPISIADTLSDGVAHKVYNTLVRLERNAKNDLEVQPELAETFDVSPDGKLYTFHLRKGVHFHNGREMKAADAEYSLRRLLLPMSKRSDWIKPFVKGSEEFYKQNKGELGIRATDEYTLQIELEAPFAPFIQHLCTINCAVVAREAVEDKSHTFSRSPIGTGPFKFIEWTINQDILFERFDDYFKGRPKLDALRFYIVKDKNLQLKQFIGGQLDACVLPAGQVRKSVAQVGAENTLTSTTLRTNYLGISQANGKYANKPELRPYGTNKLLRQAMNYALDRDYLVNVILEGRGIPAAGILPPGIPGFKAGRPGWKRDLNKARELIAQAGYPGGKGLPPISLLLRSDEDTRRQAQVIAYDFKQIGIRLEIQAVEWNTFVKQVENEPRPMFLLGWVADYPDPDNFLYVLFNSKQWGAEGNHTWYSNKEVDALTEQARTIVSMPERAKIYERVEDIILDDAPWICTYHAVNMVLLRKNVTGIREHVTPLDTGTEFPQVDFYQVDME